MIYAILTLALIISIYALGNYMLYTLPIVEAGPTLNIRATGFKKIPQRLNSAYIKQKDGNSYKYRRFVIQGGCMIPVGLHPNKIISVKMFGPSFDKSNLKEGDISIIFINDEKFHGYKIRRIESVANEVANTYYYDNDGQKKNSSAPHPINSIIGVVDKQEELI